MQLPLHIDFPFILTSLVIITGLITLVDKLFFAKKREKNNANMSTVIEFSRSFFPALLLVWIVRSFIIQPYRVPTGSLEPTVLPGDFIAVKQFSYGLRFPVSNVKLASVGEPHRGDIALFYWPVDTRKLFVKRVIGLPGDHIVYKNKTLTINGQEMTQQFLENTHDVEQEGVSNEVERKLETLNGVKHEIFVKPDEVDYSDVDVTVPPNHYFMMGDNRDDSDDSRSWGFVPEQYLIGKAFGIWMSWDSAQHHIRWDRIGKAIR